MQAVDALLTSALCARLQALPTRLRQLQVTILDTSANSPNLFLEYFPSLPGCTDALAVLALSLMG